MINWNLVVAAAGPIIGGIITLFVKQAIERKAKVISYVTQVSSFLVEADPEPVAINTHHIVFRNVGKRPATNLRIGHYYLPQSYNIFPAIHYNVESGEGGGTDVVIPVLVPGEQITISYLYYPPKFINNINSVSKYDEGLVNVINVLPTPAPKKIVIFIYWVLVLLGMIASLYMASYLVVSLVGV